MRPLSDEQISKNLNRITDATDMFRIITEIMIFGIETIVKENSRSF